MTTEVRKIAEDGYHDGWYWDMRCRFEYKGFTFVFIDVGSYSGWIDPHGEIAYAENDLLSDWEPCFEVEVNFDNEDLKAAAEALIASGEKSLVLWDDADGIEPTYRK